MALTAATVSPALGVDDVGRADLAGARARRDGTTSTATIVVAPTARAAMIALKLTAPAPNAAKLAPGPTFRAFMTAPAPVWMPQPSGPRSSSGASLGTFTTLRSFASVKVEERRLAEEMIVDRAAIVVQAIGAVGAAAAEIIVVEGQAIVRPARHAHPAAAARQEAHHHMVARLNLDDIDADFLDDACALVPKHDRQRYRIDLIADDHVGVAHARRDDAHQHFIRGANPG